MSLQSTYILLNYHFTNNLHLTDVMNSSKIKLWAIALFVISALQVAVVSCSDDPGVENYYTQSREYAADYLKNREQYSEYLKILNRARGEYNLRLVEKYLAGRGLSSVEELSVEDCDTIALNSIIEAAYFTTDINEGPYPKSNMLEHILSVKSYQEWDAQKQDSVLTLYINQDSQVIHAERRKLHTLCQGFPNDGHHGHFARPLCGPHLWMGKRQGPHRLLHMDQRQDVADYSRWQ